MDLGIAGKTAVVSASSAGLGYATAAALAEAGCKTVISGRTEDRLTKAAKTIPNSIPILADVSTIEGSQNLIRDAKSQLGTALTSSLQTPEGLRTFASTNINEYMEAIKLNLMSVVLCKKPHLTCKAEMGADTCHNINIVRQPIPDIMLSNTARAGAGFLKPLALEVAPDGNR